jgi:hypothetical protein
MANSLFVQNVICSLFSLNVFSENTLAKQCYEKVGFVERKIAKNDCLTIPGVPDARGIPAGGGGRNTAVQQPEKAGWEMPCTMCTCNLM